MFVVWASVRVVRLNSHQRVIVNVQLLLLCVFYETTYIKPDVAAVNKACCKTAFVKELVNINSHNEVNIKVIVMPYKQ